MQNTPAYIGQVLAPFLAAPQRPEGTLTYHEVQGFLFTIACSPELIKPSQWLPMIFNDAEADYASMEEAQAVTQTLMDLYNLLNTQVFTGEVGLPEDVEIKPTPLDNVGEGAALGQWSRGYNLGHSVLEAMWDHYTPDDLSDELGSSMMVLGFFTDRKLAEAFHAEATQTSGTSLEDFAQKMLDLFEDAMRSYAHLGNSIQRVLAEHNQSTQPYVREPKVGRNEPCPCGSGKKYKHCCLN